MRRHAHISLDNWKQVLRPYQVEAVNRAMSLEQGAKLLLSAPTGTGKGTMQLGLLKQLRDDGVRAWIVTPSLEVLRGYLERCGARDVDLEGGAGKLARLGEKIFVTTPVRMRNMLRGRVLVRRGKRVRVTRKAPQFLIIDEAHHATLHTVAGGGLRVLCPNATQVGFTATPYRSTPDESAALLEAWGEAVPVLTIPESIANGAWALPTWRCEPLINDDNCDVVQGDLDADELTISAAGPLADLIKSLDLNMPSCVTVSRVKAAKELCAELAARGVEHRLVTGETPTSERSESYARCKQGGAVLVSVRVLGEGVDLPWLRRWIDASPTLSPVAFLQKLGRITRPHASGQPEYVGTNRNLERHGYLLQGSLPRIAVKIAQEKFGGGSKRGARAGMIKGMRKVRPIELPLAGGVTGTMWALWHPNKLGGSGFERCILLDPTSERAVSAVRSIDTSKQGAERYGKWTREKSAPTKINGFKASRLFGSCTGPQLAWWKREAANRGLDASVAPNRAQFFALPVLKDLRSAMTTDGKPLVPDMDETERKVGPEDAATVTAESNGPRVLDGYYTVVDGDTHRTYSIFTQDSHAQFAPGKQIMSRLTGPDNTSDYRGCAFVDGTASHVWARFAESKAQIEADYKVIRGDEQTTSRAFALRSGRCWRCRRELTTPESAASGIGPECAAKLDIERMTRAEVVAKHAPESNATQSAQMRIEDRLNALMGAHDAISSVLNGVLSLVE